jgi:hypothetical protein
MSDLRTRIAQAIYDNVDDYIRRLLVRPSLPGAAEIGDDYYKPTCYVLADAVIRELGLKESWWVTKMGNGHGASPTWKADDE